MTTDRAAVLAGLGAWVPPRTVTNDDLSQQFDTSDEWIRSRTGIATRHFVDPGMATSDLAVEAGARALKSAGGPAPDALVLATTTPDRPCPGTAPDVAERLGLGHIPAFDVSAVCTGFLYALATAAGLIAAGLAERVLVIGAESFSTILNPEDRTTSVIFGDGAGAVVLRAGRPEEPGALKAFDLGSDGTGVDLITVRAGGSQQRSTGLPAALEDTFFSMQGQQVFMQAVLRMSASSRTVLDQVGWSVEELDALVGHQANLRILHAVADKLKFPREKAVVNVDKVANTAGASIPLALADAAADGTLRPGQKVLLTAFGGGLTWGSVALEWPELDLA
ncbi:3-oxoacyl-ACP synthase [Streptomyces tateyamensis]|uniref:Beta-ketoacyl-[acyl-carrier-protein] synthase III n=1 Tax=Streptomyces tateyamensis TaxID=565073 RepID=A0A2V4NJS2_9ACTN|nr:beta-ketoacyl-ACP synthase III [Streptomyces tateyamensis]PYC72362.1 3-oxoacyl-ACP synthase [Streptomyces tateyamensis]